MREPYHGKPSTRLKLVSLLHSSSPFSTRASLFVIRYCPSNNTRSRQIHFPNKMQTSFSQAYRLFQSFHLHLHRQTTDHPRNTSRDSSGTFDKYLLDLHRITSLF